MVSLNQVIYYVVSALIIKYYTPPQVVVPSRLAPVEMGSKATVLSGLTLPLPSYQTTPVSLMITGVPTLSTHTEGPVVAKVEEIGILKIPGPRSYFVRSTYNSEVFLIDSHNAPRYVRVVRLETGALDRGIHGLTSPMPNPKITQ